MATGVLYDSYKGKQLGGASQINLTTDTIKVALVSSSYTPNIATHDFFDDITNEISASGYTAGGATLANKSITVDTTNHRAYLDADDTTWAAGATITARYAIIYKSTGTASTSPLIGYIDFGVDRSVVSGETFYLTWATPANGAVFYLS